MKKKEFQEEWLRKKIKKNIHHDVNELVYYWTEKSDVVWNEFEEKN